MRIILILITIVITLFSGFMFLMVAFGGGSASCIISPDYCAKLDLYKGAATIMIISSLTGLIGMTKTMNIGDGSRRFTKFAMTGILIPLLVYLFLGQFVGSV